MKENEKVAIGWIDGGSITSGFASYISQLLLHRNNIISDVVVGTGPYLSSNRNKMVELFLNGTKAEWLLSLDSDLLIDLDSFDKLVESADSEKHGIIAGKYFLPIGNQVVLAAQKFHNETKDIGIWIDGDDPDLKKKIINGLHSVGAGYMLVHRSVFETISMNIGTSWPWFQDYWVEYPYNSWITDDIHFCNLARQYGFNIALCTNATSTHLKTAYINESTFISAQNYTKWLHDKNFKPESKKSWMVRGKR